MLLNGSEKWRVRLWILCKFIEFFCEDVFCCKGDARGMCASNNQSFFKVGFPLCGRCQFGTGGDKLVEGGDCVLAMGID